MGVACASRGLQRGRVYFADYDEPAYEWLVRCLTLDEGKELWRFTDRAEVKVPTPFVAGGLIYLGGAATAGALVATGGSLIGAAVAAALGGGAGGLMGSALAGLVGDRHAMGLQEQLDHGGLLLWVRTRDQEHEARAEDILRKHGAIDVHIHDLPSRAA